MNENKKYMISSYGADVAVGLLDSETAEEDINLSHNLFNTHVNYLYYNGVLNFNSLRKFYRYLINKNFLCFGNQIRHMDLYCMRPQIRLEV